MIRTEYEFTLPCGYLDAEGTLHRDGVMRRATAADEILPLRDPRVTKNSAYLVIILLSRVITRLGSIPHINPKLIEELFATDLSYLQKLYNDVNALSERPSHMVCPECRHEFAFEQVAAGGVVGYPLGALYEEIAFVTYHFHWPHQEVMALEHEERRRWVEEISALNRRINET